eukprot:1176189-Prorocentrum_minimum.AAC.2
MAAGARDRACGRDQPIGPAAGRPHIARVVLRQRHLGSIGGNCLRRLVIIGITLTKAAGAG